MGDTGSMALGGALAGVRDLHQDRAAAAPDRRHLRDRGAVRDHPGRQLQVLRAARLPDGADPPPLRDEGVVGDEDHGPLLDRRRDPLRGRLRALLPVLPRLPLDVDLAARRERALVVGLARSGRRRRWRSRARGERWSASTARRTSTRGGSTRPASKFALGDQRTTSLLEAIDVLVKSPGVPARGAARRGGAGSAASRSGARSSSASGCCRTRSVGVTGTNGKTTTSELLGAMLARAPVAGNVGRALTELDGGSRRGDWVVCELSCFQLEDVARVRLRGRRAAEPRARPPRPPRHVRGLPRREAADLRAPAREDTPSSPAGSPRRGRAARRVLCRRSAPGGATELRWLRPTSMVMSWPGTSRHSLQRATCFACTCAWSRRLGASSRLPTWGA